MDERSRLEALLRRLGDEERALSAQRAQLHRRLEVFPDAALVERERELSTRRRALHAQIDEVRARLGLAPVRSSDRVEQAHTASPGFDVDFSSF